MSEPEATATKTVVPEGIDPITFEVISNAFTTVVDEMGVMVEKVSFSSTTSVGKDYTCALTTPTGDVFSRGKGGLPLIGGTVSRDVVLNILTRQRQPSAPLTIATPEALRLHHEPVADCARYDSLRRFYGTPRDPGDDGDAQARGHAARL